MRLTDAQIRCLLALLSLTRLGGEIASKDVSTVLGVSRPTIYKMVHEGKLPAIWLRRRVVIPVGEFEKWVRAECWKNYGTTA